MPNRKEIDIRQAHSFFNCEVWKQKNERPNVGGISVRSRKPKPRTVPLLETVARSMVIRLKQNDT